MGSINKYIIANARKPSDIAAGMPRNYHKGARVHSTLREHDPWCAGSLSSPPPCLLMCMLVCQLASLPAYLLKLRVCQCACWRANSLAGRPNCSFACLRVWQLACWLPGRPQRATHSPADGLHHQSWSAYSISSAWPRSSSTAPWRHRASTVQARLPPLGRGTCGSRGVVGPVKCCQ